MTAMLSTMMNTPLGVTTLHRFGARHFVSSRVGDYDGERIHWRRYDEIDADSARLANGLRGLGLSEGDRVGTFMWNSSRHLEAYLAVPSMGAVLHTVNCRLSPEHMAYIINHAGDRFLIVDSRLASVLLPVLPLISKVEYLIVTGDAASLDDPRVVAYDALVADSPADYPWPEPTENAAAGICYTSGTTGNPKGVAYSQRTTYLHALASRAVDSFAVQERDVILMLPSMFHANAWGFPYSGWMDVRRRYGHARPLSSRATPANNDRADSANPDGNGAHTAGRFVARRRTKASRSSVFSRNRIRWIGGAVLDDRGGARPLGRPSGSRLGND